MIDRDLRSLYIALSVYIMVIVALAVLSFQPWMNVPIR